MDGTRSALKVDQSFVSRPSTWPFGMGLPRPAWVRLNCIHTDFGRFQSSMHKWRLAPTSIWECGALDQTAAHVILELLLHRYPVPLPPCTDHEMLVLDDETRCWLNDIVTSIERELPSTEKKESSE